jgi:hypothetical protein
MSRDNPLWGAPRIHGELLKLGIKISQASVAKYMVRDPKPPSQTWRTFLNNHVAQLASIDFAKHGHGRRKPAQGKSFLRRKSEDNSEPNPAIAIDLVLNPIRHPVGLETEAKRAEKGPVITATYSETDSVGGSVLGCPLDGPQESLGKYCILVTKLQAEAGTKKICSDPQ